jgi:hypothetical protein
MSSSEDEIVDRQSSSDEELDTPPAEPQDKDEEELELERLVFGAPSEFADRVALFSESDRRKRLGLDGEALGDDSQDGLEDLADDDVRTPGRCVPCR